MYVARHRRLRPAGDPGPVGAAAVGVPLRTARPGPVLRRAGRGHRGDGRRSVAGDSHADPAAAARCSTSAAAPAISPTAFADARLSTTSASSPTPREMHAAPGAGARAGHLRPRLGHGAAVRRRQRGHLPVVERRRACAASRGGSAAEMLRVTRPGGLAMLSYTVWLGPFGGHEMGLTHYLGGARAAARYTRKHGHPTEERLRIVVVRGIRRRRARLGGQHRRAGRRISPLPPAMGVVDDRGAGAAGVPGEQSGAGAAAAVSRRTETGSRFAARSVGCAP